MKKFIISIAILGISLSSYAQDAAAEMAAAINQAKQVVEEAPKPVYWTKAVKTTINFGQTSLTNWAAGGYNSYTLRSYIDGSLNYAKDRTTFNNRLQLDYGFLYSADKPILQKSDDRIYLESKFGYKTANSKISITANFDFKSQFTKGYTYPKTVTPSDPEKGATAQDWKNAAALKSDFLAPAYTNLGLGINYTPAKWINVNFAPLTGGLVIVTTPELRQTYGQGFRKGKEDSVKPTDTTSPTYEQDLANYFSALRPVRLEFGAQLKVDAKLSINDVFNYTTQLVLFSNYLNKPQNMRVNWDNTINYKLAKYLSLNLITNLIYDPNIMIKDEKDIDKFPEGTQRIQFKESLALGLVFQF